MVCTPINSITPNEHVLSTLRNSADDGKGSAGIDDLGGIEGAVFVESMIVASSFARIDFEQYEWADRASWCSWVAREGSAFDDDDTVESSEEGLAYEDGPASGLVGIPIDIEAVLEERGVSTAVIRTCGFTASPEKAPDGVAVGDLQSRVNVDTRRKDVGVEDVSG